MRTSSCDRKRQEARLKRIDRYPTVLVIDEQSAKISYGGGSITVFGPISVIP